MLCNLPESRLLLWLDWVVDDAPWLLSVFMLHERECDWLVKKSNFKIIFVSVLWYVLWVYNPACTVLACCLKHVAGYFQSVCAQLLPSFSMLVLTLFCLNWLAGGTASSQHLSRPQAWMGVIQWVCPHQQELHPNLHWYQGRLASLAFAEYRSTTSSSLPPSSHTHACTQYIHTCAFSFRLGWSELPHSTMTCQTFHNARQRDSLRECQPNSSSSRLRVSISAKDQLAIEDCCSFASPQIMCILVITKFSGCVSCVIKFCIYICKIT